MGAAAAHDGVVVAYREDDMPRPAEVDLDDHVRRVACRLPVTRQRALAEERRGGGDDVVRRIFGARQAITGRASVP